MLTTCTNNSELHGIWWTSSGCLKTLHSHTASGTKVTCYLNKKAENYTRRKKRKCWMSSITLWAKCLFFVQNSLLAWNIPIVQFGKQNSSNKFFLVKRWHFWTCFTLQMDMKVTEVPTISNLNFEQRCFFTCFPSINDVWNSQYSTIKLNSTLKFWKSWIGSKDFNFFLCWQRIGMIIRLKWGYTYIGI